MRGELEAVYTIKRENLYIFNTLHTHLSLTPLSILGNRATSPKNRDPYDFDDVFPISGGFEAKVTKRAPISVSERHSSLYFLRKSKVFSEKHLQLILIALV